MATMTNLRCPSCDHTASAHAEDGCWFTVAEGLLDSNLVCPCSTSRANIVKVVFRKVSRDELLSHRQAILDRVGMTYEELAALAVRRALVGDQWSVWDDVQEIDFLLDTCRNTC